MAFPADDLRRWRDELSAIQARHPEARLRGERVETPRLCCPFQIDGQTRWVRLIWPAEYPLRPPSIWETSGEDGPALDRSATGHVYADGSLCLFPHILGAEAWRPEYTAADALDRFPGFCAVDASGDFRAAVAAPRAMDAVRVSVPVGLEAALRRGGGWGLVQAELRYDARLLRLVHVDGTQPGPVIAGADVAPLSDSWAAALGLRVGAWQSHTRGGWCRIATGGQTWSELLPDRGQLAACVRANCPVGVDFLLQQPFVVLVPERPEQPMLVVWPNPPAHVASLVGPSGFLVSRPVVEDLPERLFRRVDGALSGRAQLSAARVALVGLGSLGSHVARALARAGVGRFVLFDPEVLEPENVPRHVGTLIHIGLPKVTVVAAAIGQVNPDAEVSAHPVGLSLDAAGWGTDPAAVFAEVLSDPRGLVVCTVAAHEVERPVNALAVRAGCPAVYGSVLGNAEHGRNFRVLPGETPCYECVLLAQAEDPDRFPRFIGEDGPEGAPTYAQPGVPGLGLDIESVALMTARLALQTLARRVPGMGYPDAHGDHLIWSAQGGWAVDGPLQTRVERIPRRVDCPVCGRSQGGALEPEEADTLAQMERSMWAADHLRGAAAEDGQG